MARPADLRGIPGRSPVARRTGVHLFSRCSRSRSRITAAILVCGLLSACRQPSTIGADIAVRIDGEVIHYGEFESYLGADVDGFEPQLESELYSRLFDQFLDEQLLIRLAIERGLVEPGIDQRQAMAFLLRGDPRQPWEEAQIQAYYQAHLKDYERTAEVHLRQILVQERSVAEQARQAIEKGEDFAQVAARFSQEPNAQLGGDQGRLAREDLPAAYRETIFELKPGEVTDIVAADYGFHLFQVLEHYPAEVVPLDAAAAEIRRTLDRLHVDESVGGFIQEAQERYNVTVFPANFPFDYQGDYAHQDSVPRDTVHPDPPD